MRHWVFAVAALAAGCQSKSSPAAADESPTNADPSTASPKVARTPPRPVEEIRRDGNHLKDQPSPYLEQHAHNPVDWYPWGPEALAKAKREHKPIFLSIGYSTCHWCHVMEKESFEDDDVARYLNEHFVAIKVDREQRPDVDALYIDAVGAMGGSTGWPLTVFLTPDLEPFYGGTYYPRHGRAGRPGFMDVLAEVNGMWESDGAKVAEKGKAVLQKVEEAARARGQARGTLEPQLLSDAIFGLQRARDPVNGGFGRQQKFPNTPLLLAELRHHRRTGDASSRDHLVQTLEQLMRGGIRDHLGGSFHRYAVDPTWHVPHFEKTLYDNAQLAGLYVEAGLALQRPEFVDTGKAVLDDLIRNWQGQDGGFVVGFDADDPGGEGHYYSWTPAELEATLGAEDAKLFAAVFNVTDRGDREIEGRSVLHRQDDQEVATRLGISVDELRARVAQAMAKLAEARSSRAAPGVDDKELVAWNGLAIMALADAGRWLDEPRYIAAAQRAAEFVMDKCWQEGQLTRGRRRGVSLGAGFLDDHALAGLGLVRLHAATGDARWLVDAHRIAAVISSRFYDASHGTFVHTAGETLPVRMVDLQDGVLPSGGSAAILFALELGAIAGDRELYSLGLGVLEGTAGAIRRSPFSSGFAMVAVDHATAGVREVVIAGASDDAVAQSLWAEVAPTTHARILPVRIGADGPDPTLSKFPALEGKKALSGKPTAFVCEQGSCQAPTSDPAKLREQIAAAMAER